MSAKATPTESPFDPELIEATTLLSDGRIVELYKIGGGTLGRAYEGYWGWRFVSRDRTESGIDLYTGTPATHDTAAGIVLDHFADDDPVPSPAAA